MEGIQRKKGEKSKIWFQTDRGLHFESPHYMILTQKEKKSKPPLVPQNHEEDLANEVFSDHDQDSTSIKEGTQDSKDDEYDSSEEVEPKPKKKDELDLPIVPKEIDASEFMKLEDQKKNPSIKILLNTENSKTVNKNAAGNIIEHIKNRLKITNKIWFILEEIGRAHV